MLIVILFLSSRSVLTMTDISSVRIRLHQSNSDSKRPAPTFRSIISFIDDGYDKSDWNQCSSSELLSNKLADQKKL